MIKTPSVVTYMDEFINSPMGRGVDTIWLYRTQFDEYIKFWRECDKCQFRQNDVKPLHYRGRFLRCVGLDEAYGMALT